MASFIYSIPSVERTITRPVSIEILRDVLRITNLNPNDFRVKMLGSANGEKIQNGYIQEDTDPSDINQDGNTRVDGKPNRLSTDKVLTLEVENTIMGDLTTPVRYHDHLPIFTDKALKVMVRPVYSEVETKISVVLSVKDKVEANNWLQEIKRRLYQAAISNMHSIEYYYIVPHVITKGLYEIHKLRENIASYKEDLGHYFKRCFVNNYDIITDNAGKNHVTVIREKQVNVLGFFDFDFEPEQPEKNDDNAGGWNARFTYTIRYQRPDNLVFDYPLMVHNQLIPEEMIRFERTDHYFTTNTRTGFTNKNLQEIAIHGNKHGMKISEGIPEPIFDDWIPTENPYRHIQLSRSLIGISEKDRRSLIDIRDFAESFEFKPEIQRWIKSTKQAIFNRTDNPFYFTLHSSTKVLPDKSMEIDSDLHITAKEALDLREMYHICVWVLTDISLLSADGWRDLLNNCDILHEWLESIYPNTGVEKILCNLDNTVDIDSFKEWWNNLPDTDDISGNLPNGSGLPWSDCIGSYCITKPDWDKNYDPNNPDGTKSGIKVGKTTDYKSLGHFGIIAKRAKRD